MKYRFSILWQLWHRFQTARTTRDARHSIIRNVKLLGEQWHTRGQHKRWARQRGKESEERWHKFTPLQFLLPLPTGLLLYMYTYTPVSNNNGL
eukprot:6474090-Amphidinium_carterae.1